MEVNQRNKAPVNNVRVNPLEAPFGVVNEIHITLGVAQTNTGVGTYHRTTALTSELVAESDNKVLSDSSYKLHVQRIAEIYKTYDPHKRIGETVREFVKRPAVSS